MLADFTITVHEARKPLAVQIKVHESTAALRGASKKYAKKWKDKKADFSETLGICHRFHMAGDPLCAIVRLAPPHIGVGVMSHELVHAAVHMWEIHNKFETPLTCENDEWFAWVLGDLIRQTTIQFIERGLYNS